MDDAAFSRFATCCLVDGFRATIRGVAATSSSYVGALILQNNGPTTALLISFAIAIIPPIIGATFVPETLGMRQVDFNEEKKEEKIQRALSMEQGEGTTMDYIMMSFSGEQSPRKLAMELPNHTADSSLKNQTREIV